MQPKARPGETQKKVADLLEAGLSFSEVASALGLSKPTVSYHARRLGIQPCTKFSRRYDWSEVQRYYDAGHSITECQRLKKRLFAEGLKENQCEECGLTE